ncbi:MAG: hypothetical protein HY696_04235 [Deltaproteobacteria bacterium]|nr:hypothetical protein [Deltaproteobacteria bacterium]
MKQGERIRRLVALVGICTMAACGGSSGSSSTDDSGGSTTGSSSGGGTTTGTPDTTTSTTVPGDLVVSSPTAGASASGNLARVTKSLKVDATTPSGAPTTEFQEKREALQELLAAEGECSIPLRTEMPSSPSCYGPTLLFCNHADADSTDADCDMPENGNNFGENAPDDGNLPVGDLGLWGETETSTGEACAAAQMNYLIDKVAVRIDNIVNIFGAMACAGKKAGVELPAVGASVDLSSAIAANLSVTGLTISAASIARLEDDASGNAVYQSTITISVSGPSGSTETGTLILKHIPTAADNSTYKGKLSMVISSSQSDGGNCAQSGLTGVARAGVILYEKTSEESLTYKLDFADFCGADTQPLDEDNNIDPSDKLVMAGNDQPQGDNQQQQPPQDQQQQQPPQDQQQQPPPQGSLAKVDEAPAENPDGWGGNWNHGVFSLNPTSGTGTVAFAWQAGPQDSYTRVLNATVSGNEDGSAGGTAYFGYGPDVASTTESVGSISGFFCNWAGPNNRNGMSGPSALAQRQVLQRAVGADLFTSDSSQLAIAYAPTNSCNMAADDNMTFYAVGAQDSSTAIEMTNNVTTNNSAVTHELIDLSDVSFTLPTPPADL